MDMLKLQDDITAFESNNYCYLSFENSVGILNVTNTATFMKYNGKWYTDIKNSNLTVDATNLSKVIQNDNGNIMLRYSNIKQMGNTIVTINGTGLIYKYSNGFSTNNITLMEIMLQ